MDSLKSRISLVIIGTLLTLTGCAGKPRYVAPEVESFVKDFEQRYQLYYPGNIILEDLTPPNVGICFWVPGYTIIKLDRAFVNRSTTYALEELVYHELAHCAMFRFTHEDSKLDDGCPLSIMNSYSFGGSWCYAAHRDYYFQELEDEWKK